MNKKILLLSFITLSFILCANVNIVSAQILNVNAPALYVGAYIEEYGVASPPANSNDQLLYDSIRKVITENYDNLPPQDIQQLISNDVRFKREFVERVNNVFAASFVQSVQSGNNTGSQNTTPIPANSGPSPRDAGVNTSDPTSKDFQIVPANCYGDGDTLPNADNKKYGKCGWKDIIALLNRIIEFMAYIAASLSAIAFAYAGFLYMTAAGNSGKIEQAHGIFKKTFIGIFFVLVGWLLIATLLKILGVDNSFSLLDLSQVKDLGQ